MPELVVPKITITAELQRKHPGYTLTALYGIHLIRAQSSEFLELALADPEAQEALRQAIGPQTNPSWVVARVADELCFTRHEMDYDRYDALTR